MTPVYLYIHKMNFTSHYETEYYNLQGHSTLTLIYLYIHKMNFTSHCQTGYYIKDTVFDPYPFVHLWQNLNVLRIWNSYLRSRGVLINTLSCMKCCIGSLWPKTKQLILWFYMIYIFFCIMEWRIYVDNAWTSFETFK